MTDKRLPQQKDFAAKNKKLAELQKAADDAVRNVEKQWRSQNPTYDDLGVVPRNYAYVRTNREGNTRAILTLAERMVWQSNSDKTQGQLVKDIEPMFPELTLHDTIWQKNLTAPVLRKVIEKVNGNIPKALDFRGCKNLSQIRKKIKTTYRVKGGVATFKPSITFSAEAVVFGNVSYPLEMKKTDKYNYPCIRVMHRGKRQTLRMDVLVTVLKEAESL